MKSLFGGVAEFVLLVYYSIVNETFSGHCGFANDDFVIVVFDRATSDFSGNLLVSITKSA